MKNFLLKLKIIRGKCSVCKCKIPNDDLSNSIVATHLTCKSCRDEGYYDGRCPLCNGGKVKYIGYEKHRNSNTIVFGSFRSF